MFVGANLVWLRLDQEPGDSGHSARVAVRPGSSAGVAQGGFHIGPCVQCVRRAHAGDESSDAKPVMREGLRGAPGEKHRDFPHEAPQRSKRRDGLFGRIRRVGAVDQKDHRTASCVMEDHVDDGVPVLGGHGVAGGILAGVVEEHEGTSLLVEAFAEGAVEGWYVEGTGVVDHAERHDPSPGLVGDRVVARTSWTTARKKSGGPAIGA